MKKALEVILIICLVFNALFMVCAETGEEAFITPEEELILYRENCEIIYRYIRDELKLNHAAACGIIANMHVESRFNPEALGDYGTSYGICQWHNKRYSALINWSFVNGYDYKSLDTQLAYMKYELEHNFSFVYSHMLEIGDNQRGAYSAGNYWCIYFERPKNKYVSGDARGELARRVYWFDEFNEKTAPQEATAD